MVKHRPNQAWTRAPLRKVVEFGVNDLGFPVERLACGHVVRARHDTLGPTNAERRRCHVCRAEIERERLDAADVAASKPKEACA
jgi:hypothetical protein